MTSHNGHDVINDLPPGWASCTLADAVTPGRPRGKPSDFVGQPFVGLEHIEAQTARLLGHLPAEMMRSSGVQFQEGDVLYGRMRPYLNKVWLADRTGLCSGEFIVFPNTGALRGGFLKYRLNAQDFVAFADHSTTGDRPRADFVDFGKFTVLVPPLNEQSRIADRIDELFTDLDAGVAALERVRKKLKRYRSAVLHAAVTGRLTAEWRKAHGPPAEPGDRLLARILIERRKQWEQRTLDKYARDGRTPPKNWRARYVEPTALKADDLPELPGGWCWARGEQVIQRLRSGTTSVPVDTTTKRRILRSSAVRPGRIDLEDSRYLLDNAEVDEEDFVQPNDLFMVRLSGSLHLAGACAWVEGKVPPNLTYPDRLFSARCVSPRMASLLEIVFQSRLARDRIEPKAKSTAGHQRISMGAVFDQPIPLPPVPEQSVLMDAVDAKLSQIDAMEAEVERGLARAARLRQAILKAAFEGKLVTQNPADEPGSKLLERIKAERATVALRGKAGQRPKGSAASVR